MDASPVATKRVTSKTRYPGIYRVVFPSGKVSYVVSYRVRGIGQRTKTKPTLAKAVEFQGTVRDPARQREMLLLERGRVPLHEYFDTVLSRKRQITPATRARYEGVGELYVKPGWFGAVNVSELTRDDVEAWVGELVKRGVGPGSIAKAHEVLRSVMTSAAREGKALSNPASGISLPETAGREAIYLTAEEVEKVANKVPARHRALVYCLAYTGVRIGEASALRVRDLDLVKGRLHVRRNSPEVNGRKFEGKPKSKKSRVVELAPELVTELAQHLEVYGVRYTDGSIDPDGYVFTGERGSQIRQNKWRFTIFQPACRGVGVTRLVDGVERVPRVHDLRHTAASLAQSAGFPLQHIQAMLGHKNLAMTSDLYLHLYTGEKQRLAKDLGELMRDAKGAVARSGSEVALFPASVSSAAVG